jgi:hypothetical protein
MKWDVCRILVESPEGKSYQEDIDVDGRRVLKWILNRYDGVIETGDLAKYREH